MMHGDCSTAPKELTVHGKESIQVRYTGKSHMTSRSSVIYFSASGNWPRMATPAADATVKSTRPVDLCELFELYIIYTG